MRNLYFIISIIFSVTSLNAQISTSFTDANGYTNGTLESDTRWDGRYFSVNTSNGKASTASNTAEGFWQEMLPSITDSTVSFEVNLNLNGDFLHAENTLVAQIGFYNEYSMACGGACRDFIYLSYDASNGKLKITNRNNVDFSITTKAVSNWIGSDLTVKVSLTKGADVASSYISAELINNSNGEVTDIGTYGNGVLPSIRNEVYNYRNNGKVRGFFRTVTLQDGDATNTEYFGVSSVSLTDASTLDSQKIDLPVIGIAKNPVVDELHLYGVTESSHISIYSLTGVKVLSQKFNGNNINLGNLKAGLYFLEIPGYSVKEFLKK